VPENASAEALLAPIDEAFSDIIIDERPAMRLILVFVLSFLS
jgi:hypothetical protein